MVSAATLAGAASSVTFGSRSHYNRDGSDNGFSLRDLVLFPIIGCAGLIGMMLLAGLIYWVYKLCKSHKIFQCFHLGTQLSKLTEQNSVKENPFADLGSVVTELVNRESIRRNEQTNETLITNKSLIQ